jgi:hypothetical protein
MPVYLDIDMGIGRRLGYDDLIHHHHIGYQRGEDSRPRFAICHPDQEMHARGMCGRCYRAWNHWINHYDRRPQPPQRLVELGLCRNGRDRRETLYGREVAPSA